MEKIVLITGGSRGIGAATAHAAAAKGYTVCINYRKNGERALAVASQISQKGGSAHVFPGDVSDESQVLALFAAIDRKVGRLSALVNNAGILEPRARLDEMSLERWRRVFAVNLFGSFLCAREAVKRMSTRHGGHGGAIVNVSSAAARLGGAFEFTDYAAAKGAVDTMTIGLAGEVAEEGIRVNGVRPGLIFTDIHADVGQPDRVDQLAHRVPMKRGGAPEEVADVILWLLSEEASYVTGAVIDVSGGR